MRAINSDGVRPAVSEEFSVVERTALRKAFWWLLPILTLGFLFNFLDRTAVSFAALDMNKDLGLSATQFGWGAGILFIGYCLFEVPSNLMLVKVGARVWLARIMVTWGLAAAAAACVSGPTGFYVTRFLLGVCEAGFAPGVYFYLSSWFPSRMRTQILGWFLLSVPLSAVIGGPIAGVLLQMHGIFGLEGWRWLFLLEGLPTCLVGIATFFFLVDRPDDARWLDAAEKKAMIGLVEGESRHKPRSHFRGMLADRRILLLCSITFCFTVGSYGISMWLPLILKSQGLTNVQVGLAAAVPNLAAAIGMLLWSFVVDRNGKRIANLALACAVGAVGLALAYYVPGLIPGLAAISAALIGITAARTIFFTLPARFLVGEAAAGGLALVNSIGSLGGFVGPYAVGWVRQLSNGFTVPMLLLSGFLLLSVFLSLSLYRVFPNE